jgi:hypothetical protein
MDVRGTIGNPRAGNCNFAKWGLSFGIHLDSEVKLAVRRQREGGREGGGQAGPAVVPRVAPPCPSLLCWAYGSPAEARQALIRF